MPRTRALALALLLAALPLLLGPTGSRVSSVASAGAGSSTSLLCEQEFSALGSADWTGESTVTVCGQTWNVLNGGNATTFGPDGSSLKLDPSAGDWYTTTLTAPGIAVALSTLDAAVDDDARYTVEVVIDAAWPTSADYGRLGVGFYDPANPSSAGYHVIGAFAQVTGTKLLTGGGGALQYTAASTGSERTIVVDLFGGASGAGVVRAADAQDTAGDPSTGTERGYVSASAAHPNTGAPPALRLVPSAASVVLHGVPEASPAVTTWSISWVRVWKHAAPS